MGGSPRPDWKAYYRETLLTWAKEADEREIAVSILDKIRLATSFQKVTKLLAEYDRAIAKYRGGA